MNINNGKSMKTILRLARVLISPFTAVLVVLADWLMPVRGKRILFITSIYMFMTNVKEAKPEFLKKLNEAMRLAEDTDALLLPAQLYQLFWNESFEKLLADIDMSNILTCNDVERQRLFCNLLVRSTPSWMHYGHYEDMTKDIMCALNSARCVQTGEHHLQTA